MEEQLALVIRYLRMVWHYRWLALVTAFVVCIAGWVFVITLPSAYEVNSKVFLDTRSMLQPVLRGLAVDTNAREQAVDMVRRTLLTRPNLESVIRSTDMDLQAKSPEQFEGLVEALRGSVKIAGDVRNNIFTIGYTHTDPQMALRVVESFLNIFVEKSLGQSRKDSTSTRQFIEQQIKDYEARLNAAEERLKEFKRRNMGILPGEGGDYYAQRGVVASQLEDARLLLREATNRRDELRRQVEGEEPTFGIMGMPPAPMAVSGPHSGRIQQLSEQLDGLLLKYTEQHPDVVSLKELIARLEKQNEEAIAEQQAFAPAEPSVGVQSESLQMLKVALGQAEAEVAALSARVNSYEEKAAELEKRIDEALNVEQELKALDRDYDINKRNYDELVKRRESLRLADDADKSTDQIQFNIVEPPRAPIHPTSPDRVLFSTAVLVVGFGAGIALALGLSLIRPAFYSRADLSTVTDLPVLGSVSRILTSEESVKRRLGYAAFLGGAVVLLLVYGGLVTLHGLHINVMDKLQGLVA